MSKNRYAERSKPILPDLDLLARETGLIVRQSKKFSAAGFLQTCMSSVVTGHASLNQLVAGLASRSPEGMARQSLHQRFDVCSTAFFMSILIDLMGQRFSPVGTAIKDGPIRRIIIEDATSQVMPKSNAAAFPAHGNRHGPTSGVKVNLAFDLLSSTIIAHSLNAATAQDKTLGKETLVEVRPGDLVLRDMGYFVLGEFTVIEEIGAWWLTRLPLSTNVVLEDGCPLEKHLKSCRHDIIDLTVFAGAERKKCRLVALRATPEVAKARRAERRSRAEQCGKTARPEALVRDGWHIMLTNLPADLADVSQLAAIYRARWAVEIQFRAWKQSLNLDKALNRRSNEHHMQALVLAAMIAHQLGMKIAQRITAAKGRGKLSYEKLYDIFAVLLVAAVDLGQLLAFAPGPRYIQADKRRRKSPVESGIRALN